MDEYGEKYTYKLNEGKRINDSRQLNSKMADYFDELSKSMENKRRIKGLFSLFLDKIKRKNLNNSLRDSEDVVLTKLEYRLLMLSVIALIGVSVSLLCVLFYYCI